MKDLHHKITNILIDKVYKQTLTIDELEKKLSTITKLYNNSVQSNTKHTASNGNGRLNNMTNVCYGHSIRNIQKFINVKHNATTNAVCHPHASSNVHACASLSRNRQQRKREVVLIKNSMNNMGCYNSKHTNRTVLLKQQRNASSDGVLSNNSIYNKTLRPSNTNNHLSSAMITPLLDISFSLDYHKRTKSVINLHHNSTTSNKNNNSYSSDTQRSHTKPRFSKSTKELLGKSYELVCRYQLKKREDCSSQASRRK